MLPLLDHDSSPGSRCWSTGCALLPVGYLLLLVDAYFDLRWVLFPSPKSKQALTLYYTTILTPTRFFPGYWYAVWVIYKLCLQCPTAHHVATLALFLPIAYRYVGLLRGTDTCLEYWWTILIWRILLAVETTWNLQTLGCAMSSPADYVQHVQDAFSWTTAV